MRTHTLLAADFRASQPAPSALAASPIARSSIEIRTIEALEYVLYVQITCGKFILIVLLRFTKICHR